MTRLRILLVLVVAALLVRIAMVAVPASGLLEELEPLLIERCERVDVAPGTEDVTFDPVSGLAFVSAADRRGGARGGIHLLDPQQPGSVRLVSTDAPDDFHPHGISLWTGADGERRLFVVNHPAAGGHTVEIFDVVADAGGRPTLRHAETVAYPALSSPNDVLAVGPRAFYATNDRAWSDGPLEMVEGYLALPIASVSYFDGKQGRLVARGIAFANGINASPDGRSVYVAEVLGRRVRVYERNEVSGDLEPRSSLPVPTAPDNIEVAADGTLWIGGHPRIFDFLAHAEDPSRRAPSHVVRVDPATGAAETVLVALAGELSASSVAAVHDDVLVVGAVFDGHVLVCPLD